MLTVIIILVIFAVFLIAYIIYITVRLKRRHDRGEVAAGPYQGTALNHDHPAANITPFGMTGPDGGKKGPEYSE
jgi:flagellar basal body-associated protein FliL